MHVLATLLSLTADLQTIFFITSFSKWLCFFWWIKLTPLITSCIVTFAYRLCLKGFSYSMLNYDQTFLPELHKLIFLEHRLHRSLPFDFDFYILHTAAFCYHFLMHVTILSQCLWNSIWSANLVPSSRETGSADKLCGRNHPLGLSSIYLC